VSRVSAGRRRAAYLQERHVQADLVLGLPRGGVVVAAAVARLLQLALDVIVVRKIGHPRHREFAVGALAEADVVVLDTKAIERSGVIRNELVTVIAEEKERLREYQLKFERDRPDFEAKEILIVDDGLATGATMEAAVLSGKKRMARKVLVAVPVASDNAFDRIQRLSAGAHALLVDPEFEAVGDRKSTRLNSSHGSISYA